MKPFITIILFCILTSGVQAAQFTFYFETIESTEGILSEESGCQLSEEQTKRIDQIAERWAASGRPSLLVTGHDDTWKYDTDSFAVSFCRADLVFSALTEAGIDESMIVTEALGETEPAARTGDGKREPLNRRVEVSW